MDKEHKDGDVFFLLIKKSNYIFWGILIVLFVILVIWAQLEYRILEFIWIHFSKTELP